MLTLTLLAELWGSLHYCFKYHKDSTYESAKTAFAHLNARPKMNFNNQELHALFFLIQAFDSYLLSHSKSIQEKAVVFFYRNVYGRQDTEAYDFENSQPIKRM
ncbi:MAG TPA: hypothetical protein VEY06_12455, partial [Flavisolibacter sp.]|nr:hypothetical protein [Flavisolibacter sp.]